MSNLLENIAKMNGGCAPDGSMLNPMSNLVDSFGNAAVRPRYVHHSFFFFRFAITLTTFRRRTQRSGRASSERCDSTAHGQFYDVKKCI